MQNRKAKVQFYHNLTDKQTEYKIGENVHRNHILQDKFICSLQMYDLHNTPVTIINVNPKQTTKENKYAKKNHFEN